MKESQLSHTFEGTRVRLQRMSDSRFFTGWIFAIENKTIIIRVNGSDEFEPKEEFFIQAFGDGQTAMFRAVFVARAGARNSFEISSALQTVDSNEPVRIKVSGQKCKIKLGWFESVCDIIDLSPTGFGLRTLASVEKTEIVHVSMFTKFGEIRGKGEVRYSRTIDGLTGAYRVGIELFPLDHLNQARWNQLLKSQISEMEAA